MDTQKISFALAAYALYSAISNKKELEEQIEDELKRLVDVEKNQEILSEEVAKQLQTTHSLLEDCIQINYTLIVGRPTSMKKLSASLHFTVRNTSTQNTIIVKGVQFTPIIGTTFANTSSQALFNLFWPEGYKLLPQAERSWRMSYNNLKLDASTFGNVYEALTKKFGAAAGWEKLGDSYYSIPGGCNADVWCIVNAPYVDGTQDYIIKRFDQSGELQWHGGNYLPGSTDDVMGRTLKFVEAQEVFGKNG